MSEKLVAIVQKKGSDRVEVISRISVFVVRDGVLILVLDGSDGRVVDVTSIPMEDVFSIGIIP